MLKYFQFCDYFGDLCLKDRGEYITNLNHCYLSQTIKLEQKSLFLLLD